MNQATVQALAGARLVATLRQRKDNVESAVFNAAGEATKLTRVWVIASLDELAVSVEVDELAGETDVELDPRIRAAITACRATAAAKPLRSPGAK